MFHKVARSASKTLSSYLSVQQTLYETRVLEMSEVSPGSRFGTASKGKLTYGATLPVSVAESTGHGSGT